MQGGLIPCCAGIVVYFNGFDTMGGLWMRLSLFASRIAATGNVETSRRIVDVIMGGAWRWPERPADPHDQHPQYTDRESGDALSAAHPSLSGAVRLRRRRHRPWGLAGGEPGQPGSNHCAGRELPAKVSFDAQPGERLSVATPGGGGWGFPPKG
jgi:N-methylhydantoinase B/oxoprolinase/acetone carboxylase alpha subunit